MKLDRGSGRTLQSGNRSKPFAIHAERSRGFDVMVSTMLLALLVAGIPSDHPISGEIGIASADRQSYFASSSPDDLVPSSYRRSTGVSQ
jgi:hypothetical protein